MRKHDFVSIALNLFGALMALGSASAQESLPDRSYGSWGFDLKAVDSSILPGDDFFKYSNGIWLEHTLIPSDKSRVTLRALMTDRTEARLRALLEMAAQKAGHAPSDINGKVGAFYKAFMDDYAIEAVGTKPVMPIIAAIQTISVREALGAMMGRATYDFAGTFFGISIYVDAKNPSQYAVYLNQGGLGLPDRSYYTNVDPEFSNVKAMYQTYVERLLALVGWSDPTEHAKRIIAMETRIAEAHWNKAEAREIENTYNPMTIAELEVLAPGFPWRPYLAEAKLASATRIIVAEKSAFPKIAEVFAATPLDTLQAWQAFNVVSQAARYLSKPFVDAHFEMFEKTLLGQQQQQPRWKHGVFAISGNLDGNSDPLGHLGWAVGQLYVEHYFPPALKDQAEKLICDLVRAFRARLERRDWMSPATKAEALDKLDSFIIQVGYPNVPQRDYSSLIVKDDDPIGNVRRAASLDWDFYVNRLPNPVDRNDWSFTPQVNNAANAFYLRNLTFPAALLQAPMFDPNADPAVNYGAFGAYAGHEITHGFDDQGRKIDAKGRLRDWWTGSEATTFEALATELGKQYSAFEPLVGLHVNGQLTMGENIADLGGLTLALDAYHASLQGEPAPVIDGLTGDQRVFLGWSQAWRGKLSELALRNQVATDPHSPRQYRVNGVVRNVDEWYAAFGVKPGDKLYIMPENRVRIW
jgi:putative endopeptidase